MNVGELREKLAGYESSLEIASSCCNSDVYHDLNAIEGVAPTVTTHKDRSPTLRLLLRMTHAYTYVRESYSDD